MPNYMYCPPSVFVFFRGDVLQLLLYSEWWLLVAQHCAMEEDLSCKFSHVIVIYMVVPTSPDFLNQPWAGHIFKCMYPKDWIETELSWITDKWYSHFPPVVSTQTGAKGNSISKDLMSFLDFEILSQDPEWRMSPILLDAYFVVQ